MNYETKVFGSIAGAFLLGVVFQFLVRVPVSHLFRVSINRYSTLTHDLSLRENENCTTGLLVVG